MFGMTSIRCVQPLRVQTLTVMTKTTAVCLLVLVMVLTSATSTPCMQSGAQTELLRSSQLVADHDPPSITIEMPSSSDLITNGTYANDTLALSASVVDSDGVSRVVGSYSNRSEGVWHNVTMHMATDYPDLYVADALNYTLRVNTGVVWDIRIYANDTSGASSMKSAFLDVFCLYHPKPSTTTTETTTVPPYPSVLTVVVITVAVFIAAIVIARRRGWRNTRH